MWADFPFQPSAALSSGTRLGVICCRSFLPCALLVPLNFKKLEARILHLTWRDRALRPPSRNSTTSTFNTTRNTTSIRGAIFQLTSPPLSSLAFFQQEKPRVLWHHSQDYNQTGIIVRKLTKIHSNVDRWQVSKKHRLSFSPHKPIRVNATCIKHGAVLFYLIILKGEFRVLSEYVLNRSGVQTLHAFLLLLIFLFDIAHWPPILYLIILGELIDRARGSITGKFV